MQIFFDLSKALESITRRCAASLDRFDDLFEPEIRPADPRFGDFQANGVLPYAKRKQCNPRALATELVDAIKQSADFDSSCIEIDIAGPGFINFRIQPHYLQAWLMHFKNEADFQKGAGTLNAGQKIIIDYPSPNTAKQMHIGHLRPIVIGEAVQRLLRFSGADIIRDNHIGDWGTNFGTLIMAIKREGHKLDGGSSDALEDIERLYKKGSAWEKEDPSIRDISRNELVKLQNGDPENTELWHQIIDISNQAGQEILDILKVEVDITLGESFYRDKVERVYEELQEVHLAQDSEGALVVFHPEHPRFKDYPFMIRKSDGASNYGSTDLATILYRKDHYQSTQIVYVTDGRQQDHFQQLFLTAEKWFEQKGYDLPHLYHVWFGTILGEDGKAIKTKSGDPIRLKALLLEAIDRAYSIVNEKNPNLGEEEKKTISQAVGLGAVRYGDLSSNRTGDYVFSWEKLLSFEGNSAPYLLMAVARVYSIFRKAGLSPNDSSIESNVPLIETELEIELARKLIAFPIALELAISELKPHHLCTYLYELAGQFSTFFNSEKVNVEDNTIKTRRLMLCARTMRILETGLHLLGIETLERM